MLLVFLCQRGRDEPLTRVHPLERAKRSRIPFITAKFSGIFFMNKNPAKPSWSLGLKCLTDPSGQVSYFTWHTLLPAAAHDIQPNEIRCGG